MLIWRIIHGRPRLAIGVLVGLVSLIALPATVSPLGRAIISWDIGCVVFLVLMAQHFAAETAETMPVHAARDQEGEWTIFWLAIGAAMASLGAIIGEFSGSKEAAPADRVLQVGLVAGTLLLSWLVTHILFALRYAHEYYEPAANGRGYAGGLSFPNEDAPDYWDFVYFALVLGMTFQVSDVTISRRSLRRVATVQGLLGFIFNTVILALSVNIGASLL